MTEVQAYGQKQRILIVEDDDDIQSLLSAVLSRHGFEVEIAGNGRAGLDALPRFRPDLILLDMTMPEIDGLTFLQQRDRLVDFKETPVVMLSARDQNKDVIAAVALGADAYVTKPFDNARLIDTIDHLLPRRSGGL